MTAPSSDATLRQIRTSSLTLWKHLLAVRSREEPAQNPEFLRNVLGKTALASEQHPSKTQMSFSTYLVRFPRNTANTPVLPHGHYNLVDMLCLCPTIVGNLA